MKYTKHDLKVQDKAIENRLNLEFPQGSMPPGPP